MKKTIIAVITFISVYGFVSCASSATTQESSASNQQQARQQTAEEQGQAQLEMLQRLLTADIEKLVPGSDGVLSVEIIEGALRPRAINSISEINNTMLSEPGRPYWFKLRALFKGHDTNAERIFLQDLGQRATNSLETALFTAYGIDTNSYPIKYRDVIVPTFPTEVNATATFYILAYRLAVEQGGRRESQTDVQIMFIRNVEGSPFNPSNFIVASGMNFIRINDARVTTQQDVMIHMMTGGAMGGSSNSFDPIIYPLADLMDARVAMDRKDIRNNFTNPTSRVRFVSEVIFRGQSNTTITVSTDDNVLTERMNFTGRASSITNGQRVRVYYTIAKDPLEIWEIQAIERL